jgi:5'-nucleotidase
MGMNRRDFLRLAGLASAGSLLVPRWVLGASTQSLTSSEVSRLALGSVTGPGLATLPGEVHLVILHTNDTHSRMDPFPMDGGPHQGLGGAARRATLIRRIRQEHSNVLLLDSGDVFQGTPYFNFFGGEIELRSMSEMGYDATTLGNHEFDNGVEGLVAMMPHASFPFVSANFDVSDSELEPWVRPWIIKDVGGVRVGIFGLGVAFEGLVLPSLHEGVRYTDPVGASHQAVAELRARGCSLVICLSHMGYRYSGDRPSDIRLAQQVEGIDLILGGHTHTFMDAPDVFVGRDGRRTLVNQVGFGGIRLGRIDVVLGPETGSEGGHQSHSAAADRHRWHAAEGSGTVLSPFPTPLLPLRWAGTGYPVNGERV